MARTRWTPELLDQMRVMADAGCSMGHTASSLNVSLSSLWSYASSLKIRFHSQHPKRRAKIIETPAPVADTTGTGLTRLQRVARAQLRSEIEAAKAEWETAPPYKGGW